MTQRAQIEPIRSLAFGSISGLYVAVGDPLAYPCRLICWTNNTEGDVYFSRDRVNDEIFVAAGSFKLFDIQTNARPCNESAFVFEKGTQWYVKQITAPLSGSVYIESVYAS